MADVEMTPGVEACDNNDQKMDDVSDVRTQDGQSPCVSAGSDNKEEDKSVAKGEGFGDDDDDENVDSLTPEDKMTFAASCKEAGNVHLKAQEYADARDKYKEGLGHVSSLDVVGAADIKKSLYLNLALAHNKQDEWSFAVEAATKALAIEPTNVKALYRRAVACCRVGRLEPARDDLMKVVAAEPNNIEARKELVLVREKIVDAKEQHKKAYGGMFSRAAGGLYADRATEEKRREERRQEKRKAAEVEWSKENEERKERGEEETSFDAWETKRKEAKKEAKRVKKEEEKKNKSEETTNTTKKVRSERKQSSAKSDSDVDEEDRKILEETKKKGYCYFRRDLTEEERKQKALHVPTRIDSTATASPGSSPSAATTTKPKDTSSTVQPITASTNNSAISSWNARGTTWEEKDKTPWAKDQLTFRLKSVKAKQTPFEDFASDSSKMQNTLQNMLSAIRPDASELASPEKLAGLQDLTNSLIPMEAQVTKVSTVDGDASVAVVSGTRRYLYDFEVKLSWEVIIDDIGAGAGLGGFAMPGSSSSESQKKHTFSGDMFFPEVSSTNASGRHWVDEGRTTYKKTPSEPHLKNALDSMLVKLRTSIVNAVETFENDFRDQK